MDSAVAALKLIDEGRTLETATVRLWPGGDRRSCCSPGALQRASQTAAWLGLPHHFVDQEAEFEAAVVAPFVAAYLGGETPNPCVSCNPRRLAALVGLADELGLARVATGHYARLARRDGEPYVARVSRLVVSPRGNSRRASTSAGTAHSMYDWSLTGSAPRAT